MKGKTTIAGRRSLDGKDLRGMFLAATAWLEKNVPHINSLNVFPVPDGDTGTNMLMTMRASLAEAHEVIPGKDSAAQVLQAMAKGALMGARGNSGVILSQILRGLANGLGGKETASARDLSSALEEATQAAYKAVNRPVEGTILTVIKDSSIAAAATASADSATPAQVIAAAVEAARASVARTPNLLAVLREAGVVDAGGQGLLVILEGALAYLHGEDLTSKAAAVSVFTPPPQKASLGPVTESDSALQTYGYCTEFFIQGEGLDPESVRQQLASMGDSLIVVGDESSVRVHLHTLDPGSTLSYGTSLGTIHRIKIDNIDEQHQEFLTIAKERQALLPLATVAVASGSGLIQVFQSLGVTTVVPGGLTMNPSAEELLKAIEDAPSPRVILLPNNPNVIMTAEQAKSLSEKEVHVVPSRSIPQGIASILAMDPEAALADNLGAMERACGNTRTGEITTAVRSANLYGFRIKPGQVIGFLEGTLVAAGKSQKTVVKELLKKMEIKDGSAITIYVGGDADKKDGEEIARWAQRQFPKAEVEMLFGGQPFYNFIISVE